MLGHATRPELGGVVELEANDGTAAVFALVPFVSQRFAIRAEQLLDLDAAEAAGLYTERMRLLDRRVVRHLPARRGQRARRCTVSCTERQARWRRARRAHDLRLRRSRPRTSRRARTTSRSATCTAPSTSPAPAPTWYAGSPIQVDFGEARRHEARPDRRRRTGRSRPRRRTCAHDALAAAHGARRRWPSSKLGAATVGDAWLRVFVRESARAGLADDVRALLPARSTCGSNDRPPTKPTNRHASVTARPDARRELFAEYLATRDIDDTRVVAAVRATPRRSARSGAADAPARAAHRRLRRVPRRGRHRRSTTSTTSRSSGPTGRGQVDRHRRDLLRALRQRPPLRRRAPRRPGGQRRQAGSEGVAHVRPSASGRTARPGSCASATGRPATPEALLEAVGERRRRRSHLLAEQGARDAAARSNGCSACRSPTSRSASCCRRASSRSSCTTNRRTVRSSSPTLLDLERLRPDRPAGPRAGDRGEAGDRGRTNGSSPSSRFATDDARQAAETRRDALRELYRTVDVARADDERARQVAAAAEIQARDAARLSPISKRSTLPARPRRAHRNDRDDAVPRTISRRRY